MVRIEGKRAVRVAGGATCNADEGRGGVQVEAGLDADVMWTSSGRVVVALREDEGET